MMAEEVEEKQPCNYGERPSIDRLLVDKLVLTGDKALPSSCDVILEETDSTSPHDILPHHHDNTSATSPLSPAPSSLSNDQMVPLSSSSSSNLVRTSSQDSDVEDFVRRITAVDRVVSPNRHLLQITKRLVDCLPEDEKAFLLDHLMTSFSMRHLQSLRVYDQLHSGCCTNNCSDFTLWLPQETSMHIFSFLDPVSVVRASCVNWSWRKLLADPSLYRRFCFQPKWRVSPQIDKKQLAKYSSPHDDAPQWFSIFKERYQLRRNWLLGRCKIRVFAGHTAGVSCVAFDDQRIVSGSSDSTIRVWDIRTNASWSVQTLLGHSEMVRCLQLIQEGDGDTCRLISGSSDRTIKLWDLSNSQFWSSITCKMTLTGHMDAVRCLQADKEKIVSGSYDHTLRLWSLKTGEHQMTFAGHEGPVLCLQFDSTKLVSGSHDKTIKIWSFTGECLKTLHGHADSVACLRFDQRCIVSGSHDHSLKFWDLGSGSCQRTIDWKAGEGHCRVVRCVQADHWRLLSAADDKTIKVWSVETGVRIATFRQHKDGVTCLQFNDELIISGSYDKTVILWDFSVC